MSTISFSGLTQTKASTLSVAASAIVAASALALDDDHDATVQIVKQALGQFSADEVSNFVAWGSDPVTAAEIVYAALETEASGIGDGATLESSTLVAPPPMSDAASMMAMLTMFKQIMVPMAERVLADQVAMSTRLARLETSLAALSA